MSKINYYSNLIFFSNSKNENNYYDILLNMQGRESEEGKTGDTWRAHSWYQEVRRCGSLVVIWEQDVHDFRKSKSI